MVEVQGNMKLDPSPNAAYDLNSVEEMQKTTCTKWINRDYPERCAEFDRAKWLEVSKELETQPMHFCMDRFEYPNQKGASPLIYVSWHEANELCAEAGKRLCDEAEWTFACEGEEATPYPYGYVRDPKACIVDQVWRPYHALAMRPRDGAAAMAEMDRLWQGVPSGSQPRCKSPFGVYDMTGNVDEWTHSVREGERPSILKGGYWGPVRTRCRPATRSHDENHTFYQQGFRCCGDPGSGERRDQSADDPTLAPLPRELR
jgi:formylglycine-generating enzyme required for sulfatase activity